MPKRFAAFFIPLLLFCSCSTRTDYEKYYSIPDATWEKDAPVEFIFDIDDTSLYYDLEINFRTIESYAYQNLFVFLTTKYPKGDVSQDTLEFKLYDARGRPLGDCSGSICNNQFLIMKQLKFPQSGTYNFQFHQAMRTKNSSLKDVSDIGLTIKKSIQPSIKE
jgi:gliding motility-associated lipoprotein GldH